MSASEIDAQSRFNPLLLPRIVIWSVLLVTLSFTNADPDLWGHVRFGLDTLALGRIPTTDPYSFTSDKPWVNHEWASEVVMALAYRGGGAWGLSTLKFGLLLVTFALVVCELARRGVPQVPQDLFTSALAICSLAIVKTVRPQLFSLLSFTYLVI